jgi:hypothetical protein
MMRGFKAMAVTAALLAASAGPQAFAYCEASVELPAIFQCAERAWFEPAPAGAGTVTGVFWQIGFGNGAVNNGLDSRGVGISGKNTFNGNDSGLFKVDILDAGSLIRGAPQGSLCLGSNNWANSGIDGCADNPRDATQADSDDHILNPEFDVEASNSGYPGVKSSAWVQDGPVAVLLRESTGHWFAFAAIQSVKKRLGEKDVNPGFYDLGSISNGNPNAVTGNRSSVPWQRVPGDVDPADPSTAFVRASTLDASGRRSVDLGWKGVVVHSDESVRPSTNPVIKALGLTGVGVAEMGELARYVIESQSIVDAANPITSLNPAGWRMIAPASGPTADGAGGFAAKVAVPADTCLRLHTYFGTAPRTTKHSLATCRQGICGDIGYEVVSYPVCVGGAREVDGEIRKGRTKR